MRHIFLFLVFCLILSCETKHHKNSKQIEYIAHTQKRIDTLAFFLDSTTIASPGSNKICLLSTLVNDTTSQSNVRFYSKENHTWKLNYSFEDEQWSGEVIEPQIADFNNDGYKDFKYLKGTGARGGNGIYNLFIYDKKGDSLIYVVNSNEYPNLYYNKETNSINSYILTGGNETVFMRLAGNKLKPFATIEQYDKEVTVSEYDKTGNPKVIKIDTTNQYAPFADFTNYKPLKVKN